MARLNIENKWWTDPRKQVLSKILGSEAFATGVFFSAARLAQEYWQSERSLIPLKIWDHVEHGSELVACGLAEIRPDGVYLSGSEEWFQWIEDRRHTKIEAGKKGGSKRSERAERGPDGRFLKAPSEDQNSRQSPDTIQAEPDTARPSFSYSYSSSNSKTQYIKKTELVKKEDEAEPKDSNDQEVTDSKRKCLPVRLKESVDECVDIWGTTLNRYGIEKDPRTDTVQIARLVQRYGEERTKMALRGAAFEQKTERFDPRLHCYIGRLEKPQIFEKFENLGAMNKPKQRDTVDADKAMDEFLKGRASG